MNKKVYGDTCGHGHRLTKQNTITKIQKTGHLSLMCKDCKSASDRKRRPKTFKGVSKDPAKLLSQIDTMLPGSGDVLTRLNNVLNELNFVRRVERA